MTQKRLPLNGGPILLTDPDDPANRGARIEAKGTVDLQDAR